MKKLLVNIMVGMIRLYQGAFHLIFRHRAVTHQLALNTGWKHCANTGAERRLADFEKNTLMQSVGRKRL
jgi:hypothetical protein